MIKIKKKGWIIFMTFSSWATLLAGCKKWPGDQSPVEITTEAPVAITDITGDFIPGKRKHDPFSFLHNHDPGE